MNPAKLRKPIIAGDVLTYVRLSQLPRRGQSSGTSATCCSYSSRALHSQIHMIPKNETILGYSGNTLHLPDQVLQGKVGGVLGAFVGMLSTLCMPCHPQLHSWNDTKGQGQEEENSLCRNSHPSALEAVVGSGPPSRQQRDSEAAATSPPLPAT